MTDHEAARSHTPVISDGMSSLQINESDASLLNLKSEPAKTSRSSKLTHLVVDSGAIIKRTNLTPLAEVFYLRL